MASKKRRGRTLVSAEWLAEALFKTKALRITGLDHLKDRDVYAIYFDSDDESVIEIPETSECRQYRLEKIREYFGE